MADVIKIPDICQTPGEIAFSVFKMSIVPHIVWWCSEIDCISLNILNTVELYILNGWITWYENDISIKLLNIPA